MSTQARPSRARGAEKEPAPELLTRAEVAALFGVSPRTVTGWANGGRLESVRTLGGHRRYASDQVHAALERQRRQAADPGPSHPAATG